MLLNQLRIVSQTQCFFSQAYFLFAFFQIYFYSFEVFHTAKFEEYLIPYVSLGVGLCECLSSILCVSLFRFKFEGKNLMWPTTVLFLSYNWAQGNFA